MQPLNEPPSMGSYSGLASQWQAGGKGLTIDVPGCASFKAESDHHSLPFASIPFRVLCISLTSQPSSQFKMTPILNLILTVQTNFKIIHGNFITFSFWVGKRERILIFLPSNASVLFLEMP